MATSPSRRSLKNGPTRHVSLEVAEPAVARAEASRAASALTPRCLAIAPPFPQAPASRTHPATNMRPDCPAPRSALLTAEAGRAKAAVARRAKAAEAGRAKAAVARRAKAAVAEPAIPPP